MAKIPMNQTQINHFVARINTVKRNKKTELTDAHSAASKKFSLDREVALGFILRGEAVLKEDITPDKCQSIQLLKAFDFPGDDVREAQKRDADAAFAAAQAQIEKDTQRMLDRFVLREFETNDEVYEAVETFSGACLIPEVLSRG